MKVTLYGGVYTGNDGKKLYVAPRTTATVLMATKHVVNMDETISLRIQAMGIQVDKANPSEENFQTDIEATDVIGGGGEE